jgi:hypothetical protein
MIDTRRCHTLHQCGPGGAASGLAGVGFLGAITMRRWDNILMAAGMLFGALVAVQTAVFAFEAMASSI